MDYARSAIESFKYSGFDTRCCTDFFFCVLLSKNNCTHSHVTLDWGSKIWPHWPWLIDVPFMSYRLNWYPSILFLDCHSHSQGSLRGKQCFYPLSYAQASLESPILTFLSLLWTGALRLTPYTSWFSHSGNILAAIQLHLMSICVSLTFITSWRQQSWVIVEIESLILVVLIFFSHSAILVQDYYFF